MITKRVGQSEVIERAWKGEVREERVGRGGDSKSKEG